MRLCGRRRRFRIHTRSFAWELIPL